MLAILALAITLSGSTGRLGLAAITSSIVEVGLRLKSSQRIKFLVSSGWGQNYCSCTVRTWPFSSKIWYCTTPCLKFKRWNLVNPANLFGKCLSRNPFHSWKTLSLLCIRCAVIPRTLLTSVTTWWGMKMFFFLKVLLSWPVLMSLVLWEWPTLK